uniref:Uncharacterized protein n=1 Tax=Knipowitschia caucasica TaxID=637954 RepID=A0AAV2KRX1_KNICA
MIDWGVHGNRTPPAATWRELICSILILYQLLNRPVTAAGASLCARRDTDGAVEDLGPNELENVEEETLAPRCSLHRFPSASSPVTRQLFPEMDPALTPLVTRGDASEVDG